MKSRLAQTVEHFNIYYISCNICKDIIMSNEWTQCVIIEEVEVHNYLIRINEYAGSIGKNWLRREWQLANDH